MCRRRSSSEELANRKRRGENQLFIIVAFSRDEKTRGDKLFEPLGDLRFSRLGLNLQATILSWKALLGDYRFGIRKMLKPAKS